MDEGPFITQIETGRRSELIIIRGQGVSTKKVKEYINKIVDEVQKRYDDKKKLKATFLQKRLDNLKVDYQHTNKQYDAILEIEKNYGYTPSIMAQKQELVQKRSKYKYQILDIEQQVETLKNRKFKRLFDVESKKSVSINKFVFYLLALVLSITASLLLIILISFKAFMDLPPEIPDMAKENEAHLTDTQVKIAKDYPPEIPQEAIRRNAV